MKPELEDEVLISLSQERREIKRTVRCAERVLREHGHDKVADKCLRLARAKLKLCDHLRMRHTGEIK